MSPGRLSGILERLPRIQSQNLIVGMESMDDAGVYLLTPDVAIVQTVDFFPPVVASPLEFGRIAAANSMSDVWAMGGDAVTASQQFAHWLEGFVKDVHSGKAGFVGAALHFNGDQDFTGT